jgi:3-hydroxybutyrate dehydrogenase
MDIPVSKKPDHLPFTAGMLKGKAAVVTGSTSGIGLGIAGALAAQGANVLLNGFGDPAEINRVRGSLADRHGVRVSYSAADMSNPDEIDRMIAQATGELGGVDILVNNAGRTARKPALELSREEWQEVLDLNLTAVFTCSRNAVPHLKKRGGGAIVNLASIMGFSGGLFPNASYQASKGAVVNLTRALALEWAADNIRVNAVAPTFVRTELTVPIFTNPEVEKRVMQHTPLGRLPEPEEIAAAIVYLCSPAARCITGVTLPVDSGFLAR